MENGKVLDNKLFRPACRSLLQKAVRRGDSELVVDAVSCLQQIGDSQWLIKRTAVIIFEECWPLGVLLSRKNNPVSLLLRVARTVKMKDAAGLGTLALALSKGDESVLVGSNEDHHIIVMSEAIKRPDDFWNWVFNSCELEKSKRIVESAFFFYEKGGWPWDRAFMQASAYLAVTQGTVENLPLSGQHMTLPLWVALDKHTPQGKKVLCETAQQIQISNYQLFWISFYLESARTDELGKSFWWNKEIGWRLDKIGLSYQISKEIWEKAQPILIKKLKPYTQTLRENLYLFKELKQDYEENNSLQESYKNSRDSQCGNDGSCHGAVDTLEIKQLNILQEG